MKWIQGVDEPLFVPDSDAVLPDEKKHGMGNNKLLTVSGANGKGPKPTAQPLLQFLHIHILNLSQMTEFVKNSPRQSLEGGPEKSKENVLDEAGGPRRIAGADVRRLLTRRDNNRAS